MLRVIRSEKLVSLKCRKQAFLKLKRQVGIIQTRSHLTTNSSPGKVINRIEAKIKSLGLKGLGYPILSTAED